MSLRDFVRDKIPYSESIYEVSTNQYKMLKSRKLIKELLRSNTSLKLDLGGANPGENGWLSVDRTIQCDIYWDLRLGIPFPDASVDRVYSSHLFEHLSFDEGQKLMKESIRVLKKGGTFSICVPNARIYIEGYLGLRDVPQEFYGWTPAFNETTAIDAVNYVAYMGGEHKYMFDQENLLEVLRQAGFTSVQARSIDLEVDRQERDYESIYAIAHKG
jgi:predicted SAM-dependent methyltransferase